MLPEPAIGTAEGTIRHCSVSVGHVMLGRPPLNLSLVLVRARGEPPFFDSRWPTSRPDKTIPADSRQLPEELQAIAPMACCRRGRFGMPPQGFR